MTELTLRRVAALSLVWALVVGFLPPSIMMFRNPPPEPLVLMVWVRFSTALALFIFDAYFLLRYRKARSFNKFFLYACCGVAIVCGVGVTHWAFDFPAKFTWRIIKMDYFGGD